MLKPLLDPAVDRATFITSCLDYSISCRGAFARYDALGKLWNTLPSLIILQALTTVYTLLYLPYITVEI